MFLNRALLIAILVGITSTTIKGLKKPLPCGGATKCDTYRCAPNQSGELICALADGICKVYPNRCLYDLAQCQRQRDCLPPMKLCNQKECQCRCAKGCDDQPESAVCATITMTSPTGAVGEVIKAFRNQCALDQWSCENGTPYSLADQSTCRLIG